jgi:hypothetical protein
VLVEGIGRLRAVAECVARAQNQPPSRQIEVTAVLARPKYFSTGSRAR